MAKIDAFFNLMFEQKASDVHLSSGNPPILRINGELQRVEFPPLENDTLKAMLYEITPEYKIKQFEETGDVDFGYEIPGVSRFRANFFNHKNGIGAVFRQIPSKVLSFEDFEKLEAPLPPVLKKFCMLHKGLVLVTGPLCSMENFFSTGGSGASSFSKSSKERTLEGIWRNTAAMPFFWLKKLARKRETPGIS